MTNVVISQPMYFPWPGFLAQMALADIFIWLDDAQFSKGSFTNRIQINSLTWQQSHRSLLTQSFTGLPFFDNALNIFDSCMGNKPLVDNLISSAERAASYLNICPPEIIKSSEMGISGASSDRVFRLVNEVCGTNYITGQGAIKYLKHELFENSGISVSYMDYDIKPWRSGNNEFSIFTTCLDLISSLSAEEAKSRLNPKTVDWKIYREKVNNKFE